MKKRSKPIALGTSLALFVVAAAGWNMFLNGSLRLPSSDEQPRSGEPAAVPTPNEIVPQIERDLKHAKASPPGMPGADRPKIEIPKYVQTKPKPSSGNIDGQWYQPEAMKDVKSGQ